MFYKDIIINYFISDGQGVRQAISFDLYRKHVGWDDCLVTYENHEDDITGVLYMNIILVPNCVIPYLVRI
jgi:hypothetical protein